MRSSPRPAVALALALFAGSLAASCGHSSDGDQTLPAASAPASATAAAATPPPAASSGGVNVMLCDGKTQTFVPQGTPGTSIAGALMTEWLRKNPNVNWEAEERERHTLQPASSNTDLVGQVNGQTYGRITPQDVALWKAEAERVALAGSAVFHSADELGSTVGVSCDMCHPHAANTHPETYPKYQVQLGRVALLRDMVNWCIEHPVRGKPLSSDDPKMHAIESYILAQRRGKVLEYGKH